MKNKIWIGKNAGNDCIFSAKSKMILNGDGFAIPQRCADELFTGEYLDDFFGLNLKNGEIVEIIIDTETQKYEVKRPREIGWYLTVCENSYIDSTVVARYWNGTEWKIKIGSAKWAGDDIIKVVSEKLDNEYLKSLE